MNPGDGRARGFVLNCFCFLPMIFWEFLFHGQFQVFSARDSLGMTSLIVNEVRTCYIDTCDATLTEVPACSSVSLQNTRKSSITTKSTNLQWLTVVFGLNMMSEEKTEKTTLVCSSQANIKSWGISDRYRIATTSPSSNSSFPLSLHPIVPQRAPQTSLNLGGGERAWGAALRDRQRDGKDTKIWTRDIS